MKSSKHVLISGASIAGLTAAYFMLEAGYQVTIVELAGQPRTGGAAINVNDMALAVARRMGIYEQLKAHRLQVHRWEFKDTNDVTEGCMTVEADSGAEEVEIERDQLMNILLGSLRNRPTFMFGNRVTGLEETTTGVQVTFADDTQQSFELVLGCDGLHSGVRKLWFGREEDYVYSLNYYFSLTIVNKLLIPEHTIQMYNVPGKVIMLNAYNHKTDIAFCFASDQEISYHYRDTELQQRIITKQFAGQGWRAAELLLEMQRQPTLYFDKFCQVRMPFWTKGRVALVGDAAHAASPAAGIGASLAMAGAAAIADALSKYQGWVEPAFSEYNQTLRPYINEVQANATTMLTTYLVPGDNESIRKRNRQGIPV